MSLNSAYTKSRTIQPPMLCQWGDDKELEGDTAGTGDSNWAKGHYTPYGVVLSV